MFEHIDILDSILGIPHVQDGILTLLPLRDFLIRANQLSVLALFLFWKSPRSIQYVITVSHDGRLGTCREEGQCRCWDRDAEEMKLMDVVMEDVRVRDEDAGERMRWRQTIGCGAL